MKHRITLFILSGIFLFSNVSLAQMVGDNVFLQGGFIEIGIAPNGGYGSTLSAPAGYHPNLGGCSFSFYDPAAGISTTSSTLIGFVADYGRDGWTVGTPPYFGDFYLPGDPQEGWAIEIGGFESDAYIPIYETSPTTGFVGGLAGTNVGYSNAGGIIKGIWQGTDGTLAIRQTTTLDTSKLYFTVNVVLTNTGLTPLPNIYYLRTVDPDNEETRTGGGVCDAGNFTTINTIAYQLPNPGNKVLVSATGETYTDAYLGLGTKDCRAKCMIYTTGLTPFVSCDSLWHELPAPGTFGNSIYPVGTGSVADVGIGLVFNIGTLAPGDSTSLTYAYILNASYIDSALNATLPGFTVNGTHFDSSDTINLCDYPGDSITVNILNGGFYSWRWSPDSFLHHVTGTTTVIHSDSINSNITYTITGTNTAGGCDSIIYHLVLTHLTFTAPPLPTTTYCQFATAVPLSSPGTGLLWYTSPTGGVGTPTAPTPSTLIPGTTVYYVTETVGLCHSLRNPDTVIVIPLPPPPVITDPNPYCFGQPFVPYTVAGTGVLWYTVATGGAGTTTAPTVNTSVAGNDTFWASQTVNGCEGPRQSIVTTVLKPIIPAYDFTIHYGCKGDTLSFTNSSIGAINYLWSFGDGSSDTATNPVHIYHTQDTFKIKLVAINAQCADSTIDTVPLIHPLNAAFSDTPGIVCQKSPVTFSDSSIGTGLSYTWYFGNGVTSNSQNPVYTYSNTGTYHVQLVITDFVPCHDTAASTIYVDSISAIRMAVTDSVLCRSTYITLTGNYSSLGNTGVTWYFGEGDSIKNVNPVAHAYDDTGKFTVTVVAHYRACKDTSVSKDVRIYPVPSVNLGADTSICPGGNSIVVGDHINTAATGAKWKWSTGQTTPTITIVEPGHYSLIVDVNGCYSTDTILVLNDCYMNIPNVFTPNGDGLNDYFFPRDYLTKGLTTFNMEIYNRWGQLIFQTQSLDGKGWDGKLNDVAQPVGVYIYTIDATFRDGQKEHHQGNVTLLR